jgi:hypothetical protein
VEDEKGGGDRGAEPAAGVDRVQGGVGDRDPLPRAPGEHRPGDLCLAQQRDRRPLVGQVGDQLQPHRFGQVEVRGPGHRGQPRQGVHVAPGRAVGRAGAGQAGRGHPRRVADYQQVTAGPPGQVPGQVQGEDVALDDLAVGAGAGRVRRLDLDAEELTGAEVGGGAQERPGTAGGLQDPPPAPGGQRRDDGPRQLRGRLKIAEATVMHRDRVMGWIRRMRARNLYPPPTPRAIRPGHASEQQMTP